LQNFNAFAVTFLKNFSVLLAFAKVHLEEIAKQDRKEADRHSAVLRIGKIISQMRQPFKMYASTLLFGHENAPLRVGNVFPVHCLLKREHMT
jgi:hypothetical protein